MTAPITVEEYNKDKSKVDAIIYSLGSAFMGADYSGQNPTMGELKLEVNSLRRYPSLGQANKVIALIDKAAAGPNLSTEQKVTLNQALATVTSRREQQGGGKEQAAAFKATPTTITPGVWEANDKVITDVAKEVVASLTNNTSPTIRDLTDRVSEALAKEDKQSLYIALGRLQVEVDRDPALSAVKGKLNAISKPLSENQRSSNGKSLEAPPQAPEAPPKPQPAAGKLCEPITHERWGVRFRFLDKPPEKVGDCESKGDGTWDLKDWFLQLLPAMQSVIPRQGARDVPNAGPGLSFKFKNNMVKHKIPGSQPVYQMMGVDSAIITFVGTFTGDGGLGYINKVDIEDGELKDNALKMLEAEGAARRAGQAFAGAKKYGGEYPYGTHPVNAMFNPIYHVRNRALAPGGDTSSALVGSNSTGWLMDNSILRQGFFERDGCPGQCPPPSWKGFPNGHMDEAGGKFAWGDFGTWPDGTPYGDVGTRSQMDTHKLAHIAAYLDAYHEMVSFYKFAVQGGKLMEITINLRKTHDGLKPRVADPRMKGKLRSDTPDPLRDMHTGNPTFKGYLRSMSTWAQYSDRVWYAMEFEVVDHGLHGKKAVNLTNKVGGEGAASSDGGVAGEAPGSTGSDDAAGGVSSDTNPAVGKAASSSAQVLKESMEEEASIPDKEGGTLILRADGTVLKGDKVLSYDEAYDKLNFYDLVGRSTLYNWFNSHRVVPSNDGNSISIRNNDGSVLRLDGSGTVLQYPKGSTVGAPAPPNVMDALRAGDMTGLNSQQQAVINEWRAKYLPAKVVPVPSTTPAPSIPSPAQMPIQKLELNPPSSTKPLQ